MRYAIYFTPAEHDLLHRLAAAWLGRDAFTGAAVAPLRAAPLAPSELAFHTAPPRRYGFHATLKAPFRLADGVTEAALRQALDAFALKAAAFSVRLAIGRIDGFFALRPEQPSPELDALAGSVVTGFDAFRAPLTERELERRNPGALNPAQFRNLHRWGYPYVLDTFRFHMTLTGRVAQEDATRVRAAIEGVFAEALAAPVPIDGLALFVEPEPGAPFTVSSWHALGSRRQRRTA